MDVVTPARDKKRLKICTRKKEGRCLWRHPDKPRPRGIFLFHTNVGIARVFVLEAFMSLVARVSFI
jgi:hypothetical protein